MRTKKPGEVNTGCNFIGLLPKMCNIFNFLILKGFIKKRCGLK
ncbi:hypothetical protein DCCM_3719 [Desulfocucumis palustris]|uniref:Uncharacterized protein n=1 Tax=Desulfocucumis palustris TaxID=1898651 RepID=A0A2L2XEL5_9FIRM|nr:hypothetical protein DCCM_3719 [Desulfocucumis palustris]